VIKSGASHRFVKIGYYVFVAMVCAVVLYSLWLMALPIIGGLLLSLVFEPAINYFETKGFKRFDVLVGLTVALCLAGGLIAWLLIPHLVSQVQNIASDMPHYRQLVQDATMKIQALLQSKFPQADIPDLYGLLVAKMGLGGKVDVNAMMGKLSSVFSVLSIVVIIPVVTFFLLADGHLIRQYALSLVPNTYFEMVMLLFNKIGSTLKLFLRGQMIDAFAVAVMTSIGLSIIGLPYALLIAIVAGLGNMIPYLGPIIGFMPALLVILLSPGGFSVGLLLGVVIVFVLVQFIEGTFVYPLAVGKSVELHPLVVIIGITVGGQLGGIIGMLVTIPLIAMVKVSLEVLHTYLKAYTII
jgi:predicted PurR-regulated permease PerM